MNKKVLVFTFIIIFLVLLNLFGIFDQYNLSFFKSHHASIVHHYQSHHFLFSVVYFVIYVGVTALSLPLATILTLVGSSVMGFTKSLVLISFASTIGATLAFLISRYLISDFVRTRYNDFFTKVDQGITNEGPYFLLTLRLLPMVPFFVINLTMGLTKIKTRTYYFVSQLGMLAGTAVYVNAGTQFSKIEKVSDIMSLKIVFSFALIGLFPLLAKKIINHHKRISL